VFRLKPTIKNKENTMANTLKPLWNGPRFEVSVALEALMIGKLNQANDQNGNVPWADISINYQSVRQGANGLPKPFARLGQAPGLGVHLHWTLPKSMRNGQQLDNADVRFPQVPNRWLILRSRVDTPGSTINQTAWVLESNFTGSQNDGGTIAYPDDKTEKDITYLGKRYDLTGWTDSGANMPLTAVAPGDIGFTAVYDNVVNVFAFYDDMSAAPNGLYSYQVIGWYADPTQDILYNQVDDQGNETPWTTQEEWQQIMDSLHWKTRDLSTAEADWQLWKTEHNITGPTPVPAQADYPAQTLSHGLLFNLDWKGVDQSYDTGTPPVTGMKTSVGNTPVQAISAWLADNIGNSEVERLIEAFHLDYIYDFTSNQVRFEELAHSDEFKGVDSGKIWRVIAARDQQSGAGNLSVELSEPNTEALTVLNTAQRSFNDYSAKNAAAKADLFACGWKLANLGPFPSQPLKDQITSAITALNTLISVNTTQLTSLSSQIQTDSGALKTSLGGDFILETTGASRFYQTNDPVIMIANAETSHLFTDGGSEDGGTTLVGRFTGQNMTALTVEATLASGNKKVVFNQAVLSKYVSFAAVDLAPKETLDLWVEGLLVNTDNAMLLAQWFFKEINQQPTPDNLTTLADSIRNQQSIIWNPSAHAALDAKAITVIAKFNGVVPEKISVQEWQAPWEPLYFDWEVEWFPANNTTADILDGWDYGEIDFNWTSTDAINTSNGVFLSGRTLMDPQVVSGLQDKLQHFVDNASEVDELPIDQQNQLKEVLTNLGNYDVLTQSLGGFVEQLITRDAAIINPLYASNSSENAILSAINTDTESDQHWWPKVDTVDNDTPFFPVRGGHFRIKRFWVINSYGRFLASSGDGGIVLPIRSESVVTPGGEPNKNFCQLPPRWSQPARLNFNLLDASHDNIISNSSDLTSSICGWVLSNHLDEALMVYDAKGNLLGQVQAVTRDHGTGLRWDPVAGKNFPYGQPPQIGNSHLNGFITGLLAKGANDGSVLSHLLSVIDASLWQTDSLGKRQNSNLSVLVGFPLAVVRAKTGMELMGYPATNQNWSQTGNNNDDNVTAVPFPVRVGDSGIRRNGVMGYFSDNNYNQFNAVYGYDPSHNQTRLNLMGIKTTGDSGPSDYIVTDPLLHLPPDNGTDNPTEAFLTLLVDPRGEIPIGCGATPLKEISLAPGPVAEAMDTIEMTFRTGPILVDPDHLSMPLPGQISGKWSWLHRSGVTMWQEQTDIITQSDTASFADEPPMLQQGWLKLSGGLSKPTEPGQ
jgi:hypothetical protein